MTYKRLVLSMFFLTIMGLTQIIAQKTINSTGGKASGSGGSVNYSVGQTVFNTWSSETGTISEGVQQPFEIFATTGIEINAINLIMKVYPNPTKDYLNLIVENIENGLFYQLFDIDGKMLKTEKINSTVTQIEMIDLRPSSYFIKVIKLDQVVKAFKIIKK